MRCGQLRVSPGASALRFIGVSPEVAGGGGHAGRESSEGRGYRTEPRRGKGQGSGGPAYVMVGPCGDLFPLPPAPCPASNSWGKGQGPGGPAYAMLGPCGDLFPLPPAPCPASSSCIKSADDDGNRSRLKPTNYPRGSPGRYRPVTFLNAVEVRWPGQPSTFR